MKVLSLFSGIGAFEKALDYLNIKYELVNYCEIDKYASKAYSLIHKVSEDKNLGDITKVDTSNLPNDIDLISYGFPCQDISLAGKQKGFADEEGNITRSGLFFQALRIIEDTKPKIAIAENVKNLVSKRFKNEFEIVLSSLEQAGYNNYWKVLNAKDYGIPQNRERVFIVSIRKDIDTHTLLEPFHFPEPYELKLRLKDMLEDEVDEKYYLSDVMIEYIVANHNEKTDKLIQVGNLKGGKWDKLNESCRRVYDTDGIAPTIHTCQGGNTEPKIIVKSLWTETQAKMITPEGNVKRYIDSDVVDEFKEGQAADISFPKGYGKGKRVYDVCPALTVASVTPIVKVKDKRGNVFHLYKDTKQLRETIEKNEFEKGEPLNLDLYNRATYEESQTLCDPTHNSQRLFDGLRIRKLTPKECFRLMGFEDDCVDVLIENGISNTQLYKMAGNSIVVDVLEEIFVELLNLRYVDISSAA